MDFYRKLPCNRKMVLFVTVMHLHTSQEPLPAFAQSFLRLERDRKLKTVRHNTDRKRAAGGSASARLKSIAIEIVIMTGQWRWSQGL